jgi:uncharacterized protein YbjT (DUF2867 family)
LKVLVTGATGYIGGRLIPRLLEAGHEVRAMARNPERLQSRKWATEVEVVRGDLLSADTLPPALDGCQSAFYLVHSMGSGSGFESRDRQAAQNFVRAARELEHVVYLGGLLPEGAASDHLRSRAETGEVLSAGLPMTEFRAGPIIGSGSASFEMVRYLTERLPIMIAPRWILNPVQPVAIRNVLAYLLAALDRGPSGIVDIGADRLTFREMMLEYARVRGERRVIIPVPVLAPTLAALWVGLVTPIPNSLAVPLVRGIVEPVLADTTKASELFPDIHPITYSEAVQLALTRIEERMVETRWSTASGAPPLYRLEDREGLIRETQAVRTDLSPELLYRTFTGLGGERGWLTWHWAWEVRGFLDQIFGGPGLRRGRRDPDEIEVGEALDFWRVEALEPNHLLRLRAEMKVPGRAWLQFEAVPDGKETVLVQTALFEPRGLLGLLYWYLLYPIHWFIFRSMVRAVATRARARLCSGEASPSTEGNEL